MDTKDITTENNKKEQFKVIPVFGNTRDRLKNDMRKVDTYDSYINQRLDELIELREQAKSLLKQITELKTQV